MGSPPRIVVLDDTQNSELLIRSALLWAETLRAGVRVVRVIGETVLRDTTRTMGVVGPVARKVREAFIHEGTEEIHRIAQELDAPPSLEIEVVPGNPMEAIKEILDRSPVDLLILSPSLRGSVGTITSEMIGYSKTNCLVVSQAMHRDKPQRILLATHGSEKDHPARDAAMELAENFRSLFRVLSVVASNEELQIHGPEVLEKMHLQASKIVDEIVDRAVRKGLHAEGTVKEGGVPEAIVADSREWSPDLIVVGSFSRTGLNRLFMGSVAGTIITQVMAPVLIVKKALMV